MARTAGNKFGANFSKGIVQETGPLGYPENSAKDMLNMHIQRDGSVRVRNGLVRSGTGFLTQFPSRTSLPEFQRALTYHEWPNAGGERNKLLIRQHGDMLNAYRLDTTPIHNVSVSSDINFYGFKYEDFGGVAVLDPEPVADILTRISGSTPDEIAASPMKSVSGNGVLFMTSRASGPFYLKYYPEGIQELLNKDLISTSKSDAPTIVVVPINIEFRDFKGEEDGLDTQTRPTNLGPKHLYNLLNQGWTRDRIGRFFNGASS